MTVWSYPARRMAAWLWPLSYTCPPGSFLYMWALSTANQDTACSPKAGKSGTPVMTLHM